MRPGGQTNFSSALIFGLFKYGQKAESKRLFDEIIETSKSRSVSKYVSARSHAALGENEKALDILKEVYQKRDSLMIVMKTEQVFDEIRDTARFQSLLKQLNL